MSTKPGQDITLIDVRPISNEPADIVEWIYKLTENIVFQLNNGVPRLAMLERHAVPTKPRDGQIFFADGTDWNPGSGQGFYGYYAGAFHFLG